MNSAGIERPTKIFSMAGKYLRARPPPACRFTKIATGMSAFVSESSVTGTHMLPRHRYRVNGCAAKLMRAKLRADHFAADDNLHSPIFLPALRSGIVCNRHIRSEPNR